MTPVLVTGASGDPDAEVLHRLLPGLTVCAADAIGQLPAETLVLADVGLFLAQRWNLPTVVLAGAHEAVQLADAWQAGALSGWVRGRWPESPLATFHGLNRHLRLRLDCQALPKAAQFQQQMLPVTPDLPGYRVSSVYRPAAVLSGDWVDGWFVEEHHYLCYLADVAGHGLASSLLTPWLASFHQSANHPLELLRQINQKLIQQKISRHITALAILLDLTQHRLWWCSAGHYPGPIVINADGQAALLKSSTLPLGLSDWVNFEMQHIDLVPGSRVVLTSDGTLELFEGSLGQRVQELAQHLSSSGLPLQRTLQDDVTLICLHRLPLDT